jgi:hypothetical protein
METVQEVDESKECPSSPSPTTPPTNTFSSDSASQQTTAPDTQQQHQQTPNCDSPIPPLTSISSASTTSPNSVRLNQEYVEMHPNVSTTILTTPIFSNLGEADKSIESQQTQFNDIHKKAAADLEADAKLPLLHENDDNHSTNVNNTNNSFSIDEKDSLLDNEN